jgi:O-antigen ligase/tetratricopeptide (TPR) repeat protein
MMQPSATTPAWPAGLSSGPAVIWTVVFLPLLVALAVFLGGATQRSSEAIVVGFLGLLLLVRPVRISLGPVLNVAALLFLGFALAAFLPGRWFAMPAWRVALTNDFGVALPATVSAQPWMTLDSFFLLLAGVAWVYYVTTFDAPMREIRLSARLFASGIVVIAGLSISLYLRHEALPFWHNRAGFGPFPNRNQTGDLFGISALVTLACLEDDFRRRHKRWLLWLPALGILIAALILDYSRSGIIILVMGTAAWLSWFASRRWGTAGIAIAASFLLLLFAGLLLFGGETIARFHLHLGSEGSVTSDFRWLIFRDTFAMIRASPLVGVGLGNFESVFALFRHASRGITRSLHPESDWLWVWAEMGWPALLVLLVATGLFVRGAFPLKPGTNQRLRYALLVAAMLFALHGFVDVSGHRFGSFLAGTFLLGLAQARPVSCRLSRWSPILSRCVGVLLVAVCAAWLAGWRQMLPIPGRVGVESAKQEIVVANRGHRFSDAVALADRALEWAPLDWQLYYLRAVSRIGQRQSLRDALADFRRARFLEPNSYELPFEEGKAWLGWQPTLAMTAWREALGRPGAAEARLFDKMLGEAANYDVKTQDALREFAIGRPGLTINYLKGATPKQFEETMRQVLERDPGLNQFSPEQKRQLFELWSSQKPIDRLLRALDVHPQWMEFAWPGIARDRADHGEFESAWQLVRRYAPPPALPKISAAGSIPELEQKVYANPGDYAAACALYRAQLDAGKTEDALATLRHVTDQPGAPAYFQYLEAEAWAGKQDWERAWRAWEKYEGAQKR